MTTITLYRIEAEVRCGCGAVENVVIEERLSPKELEDTILGETEAAGWRDGDCPDCAAVVAREVAEDAVAMRQRDEMLFGHH